LSIRPCIQYCVLGRHMILLNTRVESVTMVVRRSAYVRANAIYFSDTESLDDFVPKKGSTAKRLR
jgi:hypothetical protein